ncbi:hypothetical protein HPP92_016801 [Vanilla planifolia]|uniref:Uncharacterized protein n=1 Tax=Vanilla planifolia TaxID=51239 RepID=A0A835UTQ5_VANPL|nr:hypothetical protein HPP92_017431 [Vanilla planifolia]KAG0472255.1 hypothetical protein HPP92_016801 [Vanilla planifolia]
MRLWTEEEDVNRLPPDEKRNGSGRKPGEDEEDGVPVASLTSSMPFARILCSQAIAMVTLETDSGMAGKIAEGLTARLRRAFEEAVGGNVGEKNAGGGRGHDKRATQHVGSFGE